METMHRVTGKETGARVLRRGLSTLALALSAAACGPSREPSIEPGGLLYEAALRDSEAARAAAIAALDAREPGPRAEQAGPCSVFVPGLGAIDVEDFNHRLRHLEKGEEVTSERGTFKPSPALVRALAETARFLPPENGRRGYLEYAVGEGSDLEVEPAPWLSKPPPLPLSYGCYSRGRSDYAAHVTAAVSRAQRALHAALRCSHERPAECVMDRAPRDRAQRALDRLSVAHKERCKGYERPEPTPMRSNEDDAQYRRRVSEDERGRRAADLWYGNAAPTDDDLEELARTESWREERVGVPCALGHLRTVLAAAALFEARADKRRAEAAADATARERREHQQALARRFQPVERECAERWLESSSMCAELPNLTEPERAACQGRCKDAASNARRGLLEQAMRACLDEFVSRGPGASCKASPPAGAAPITEEVAECTRTCRKSGPETKALRAREAAEQGRAAREAAGRGECTNGCVRSAHAACDGKPTPFERDLCISSSLKPCCRRCGSSIAEANHAMCN